jgi:hypothetical protein
MSIIIALAVVLIVGALIANFYPAPISKSTLAQGEILTPDSEDLIKLSCEGEVKAPVVEEPAHIDPPAITTQPSDQAAAKMSAKPNKKYYHNNNKKAKTNK